MFNTPSSTHAATGKGQIAQDDAVADRITLIWIAGFMAAALMVLLLSTGTEIERAGSETPLAKIAVFEVTGFGFILALYPLITRLVTHATPGQHAWRQVIPFHIAGSIVIALIHMGLFVGARKVIMPLVFGEPYTFSDDLVRDAIYEYRKSALAYGAFVISITHGRFLQQQQRELAAARENARTTQKLTLKCGGRTMLIDAEAVRWVKSAANYVEVAAGDDVHFARSTLAAIERQLTDAGAPAARVHRSYIVNCDFIEAISPTGEGDVKIKMRGDNAIIPGSRRYRDRLPEAAPTSRP